MYRKKNHISDHIIRKRKAVLVIAVITIIFFIYFVGSGFIKNPDVYIHDYTVSANGTEITIHTHVSSPMGYIRKAVVHQQHGGHLYLDFYSAFGGINGTIGANNVYTLPLHEETYMIGIYRNTDCYEEALVKGKNGLWKKAR